MINAIQNGVLLTDIDALTLNILNCNQLSASNVVGTTNPALTDARNILDGTVTDSSVAANAAIVQSKLSLNGAIPTDWLGKTDTTAAQGDLYQPISERDQPNGYPSLGAGKKMATGMVPLSGTGTVTEIEISLPENHFWIVPDVSTPNWMFTGYWTAEQQSWFGNATGSPAPPKFNETPIPLSLIPSLAATAFSSGTFDPARLPLAVGVGGSHAVGAVPVPDSDEGLATDYLARDMTFKTPGAVISYQPVLPDPSITLLYYMGPVAMVNITESVKGTNLFYNLDNGETPFKQITTQPVQVAIGTEIIVYASKIGYNNSNFVKLTIPDPAQELYA